MAELAACPAIGRQEPSQTLNEKHAADIERQKKRLIETQEHTLNWRRKECGPQGFFSKKTFDNFKRELAPKAFDILRDYKGQSIVLRSDAYGVGKTHLVAALANHLIETKPTAVFLPDSYAIAFCANPVLFITEMLLLVRIRQTFNLAKDDVDAETEEMVYSDLKTVELLVIDDVGKVRPRDPSFLQSVYFRILDERYIIEMPVILTTNLTLPELEAHIGGATSDRLREMCGKAGFISIPGKSYRR